jgi:diphthine methyl ester synthase
MQLFSQNLFLLKDIHLYNKIFSKQKNYKFYFFHFFEPIEMLYLIGLGLGDEKDITIKGLEAIDKCDILYLEHYTSILTVGKEKLEKFYSSQLKKEVQIILADRELIESECDEKIIEKSKKQNVGVLIVGDPFGATTHADIMVRAKQLGIEVGVVHNASIMFEIFLSKTTRNAIGACGLQLYRFGQTVSIVFFTENWRPDSFYDYVKGNLTLDLHTL